MEHLEVAPAGRVDDEDVEVIQVAKLSNAHEFIAGFVNGYNTDVGEGSTMVSGGQKQRIAIARALIKKEGLYHQLWLKQTGLRRNSSSVGMLRSESSATFSPV